MNACSGVSLQVEQPLPVEATEPLVLEDVLVAVLGVPQALGLRRVHQLGHEVRAGAADLRRELAEGAQRPSEGCTRSFPGHLVGAP